MRFSAPVTGGIVACAAVLTLAACSSSTHSGTASMNMGGAMTVSPTPGQAIPTTPGQAMPTVHNEADVSFATDMVPHHGQAVEMADMALAQASNATIKTLATQIKAAQGPEIASMTTWLTEWKAPVPSTSMSGSQMGGMSMNGMMSAAQMTQLSAASGVGFDKLWLQMMINHHTGAIEMARTELSSGQNPAAKKLAQSIIDGQSKELATMNALLPTIG